MSKQKPQAQSRKLRLGKTGAREPRARRDLDVEEVKTYKSFNLFMIGFSLIKKIKKNYQNGLQIFFYICFFS